MTTGTFAPPTRAPADLQPKRAPAVSPASEPPASARAASRASRDFSTIGVHPSGRITANQCGCQNERTPRVHANADGDLIENAQSPGIGANSIAAQSSGDPALVAAPTYGVTPVPAAPTCANPGLSRTVTVDPVFIKSSATDTSPTGASWSRRLPPCNTIWGKLGVTFSAGSSTTVTDAAKKTSSASTLTEFLAVLALYTGSNVGIVFVDNDMTSRGGGGTISGGGGSMVVSDRGTSNTLIAHELGHTLGLEHPPGGADTNTIMTPSGSNSVANPTRNTMVNYNKITWPAGSGSVCLNPDP